MPLILSFTDTDGTPYTESYWRVITLNINEGIKTASFQFHGWRNLDNYLEGKDNLRASPKEFSITNPADYDTYLGQTILLQTLETYVIGLGGFFATADIYSYILVSSADIGSFNSSRLYVRFTGIPGGSFTNGVTIKVNGSPVSILDAATDTPDHVIRYDLDSPIDANDVVTWEYDASVGFMTDEEIGTPILSVPATTVENQIGSFFNFSSADNSIHLATAV